MIGCQMSFQNIFLNTIQFIATTPEILLKVIISYQESKRQLVQEHYNTYRGIKYWDELPD